MIIINRRSLTRTSSSPPSGASGSGGRRSLCWSHIPAYLCRAMSTVLLVVVEAAPEVRNYDVA